MTARQALLVATGGSVLLMAMAFGFQYLGGMAPCKLCIWQRYPHVVAIAVGVLALSLHQKWMALLGAGAAVITSAVGFYHAGVEQGWWKGPSSCTSGDISGLSTDALLEQIMSTPLVRCDEIPWQLLGVSMAGWNGLLSLGLAVCWIFAYRRA